MEYGPEIAVFQSAFLLAEQLMKPKKLKEYGKGSHDKSLAVLTNVVREIKQGLGHDSTETISNLNMTKITITMLVKVLYEDYKKTYSQQSNIQESLRNGHDNANGHVASNVQGVSCGHSEAVDPSDLSELLSVFDSVVYGLPSFSWSLLFDVIKGADIWADFMKVLHHVPAMARPKILHHFLLHLVDKPDDMDQKHLVDIMYFISLHERSPLYQNQNQHGNSSLITTEAETKTDNRNRTKHLYSTYTRSHFVPNQTLSSEERNILHCLFDNLINVTCDIEVVKILEIIVQGLENMNMRNLDGPERAILFLSLQSLVSTSIDTSDGLVLSDSKANIRDDIDHDNKESSPLDCLNSLVQEKSELLNDKSFVEILASEVKIGELPLQRLSILPNPHLLECVKLLNNVVDLYVDSPSDLRQDLLHYIPSYASNPLHKILWKTLSGQIVENCLSNLSKVGESHTSLPLEEIRCLYLKFKPMVDTFQANEDGENLVKSASRLQKAEILISKHIRGWREELSWLLGVTERDLILNPRWIGCIEQSCPLVNESHTLGGAVHKLRWLRENQADLGGTLVEKYSEIVLGMVGECSLQVINTCIQDLSESMTQQVLAAIFNVTSSLDNHLRSALNRLTNENQQQCAHVLAVLGLQSPVSVVRQIVNMAIHNKGQIQALVQVLQQLPSLMRFGQQGVRPLLTSISDCCKDPQSLTENDSANLVLFSGQLMQVYRTSESADLQEPLLPPGELLQNIILPTILTNPSAASDHHGNHRIWTRLLATALKSMADLGPDWLKLISQSEPVLLIYLVCHRLELASCRNEPDLQESREDWLECLELMQKICSKYPGLIKEGDVAWLQTRTQQYSWLNTWYIFSILADTGLTSLLRLELPCSVLELVSMPEGITVTSELEDTDGILSMLLLSRISDVTLNLVHVNMKSSLGIDPGTIENRLIYCLSLLLEESGEREWVRLCRSLQMILTKSGAQLGTSIGVACVYILLQSIQLVSEMTQTAEIGSRQQVNWNIMTTRLVTAIKKCVLEELGAPSAARDLCQSFQLLCNSFCYWPDQDSAHLLLPLPLDIISRLDSCLTNQTIEESKQSYVESSKRSVFNYLIDYCESIPFEEIRQTLCKVLSP